MLQWGMHTPTRTHRRCTPTRKRCKHTKLHPSICPPFHSTHPLLATSTAATASQHSQQQTSNQQQEPQQISRQANTQPHTNTPTPPTHLRYAILGGGLAGVSTAWELLQQARQLHGRHAHVEVLLFSAHGIASGGSGAAAGLLHPYSPRGKLLWKGEEALQAAMDLTEVAAGRWEGAAGVSSDAVSNSPDEQPPSNPFVWTNGLIRPAASAKQVGDILETASKARGRHAGSADQHIEQQQIDTQQSSRQSQAPLSSSGLPWCPVHLVSGLHLQQLLPGLDVPTMRSSSVQGNDAGIARSASSKSSVQVDGTEAASTAKSREQGSGAATASKQSSVAGFYVPQGLVIDVPQYLQHLWGACQAAAGGGGCAVLRQEQVHSVKSLQREHGPFNAVIVAAGAAVGALADAPLQGLPLQLCQGYTVVLQPGQDGRPYPQDAPSMLGQPYVSAQGQQQLVVGATQQFGLQPKQALSLCNPARRVPYRDEAGADRFQESVAMPSDQSAAAVESAELYQAGMNDQLSAFSRRWLPGIEADRGSSDDDATDVSHAVAAATQELVEGAAALWPALEEWKVKEVRSGVRAIPPRVAAGAVPLLGRLRFDDKNAAESDADQREEHNSAPHRTACWLFVGLGARGLLYHALFAKQLAAAVLADDEGLLEAEATAWGYEAGGAE